MNCFNESVINELLRLEKIVDEIQNKSNNEIVVYTAMTNSYDELPIQKVKVKNIDFIFFNDQVLTSEFWNVIKFNIDYKEPRRTAKIFKLLPHLFLKKYKTSIWIDSNMIIEEGFFKFIDLFSNSDKKLALLEHNRRNCIYKESSECLLWGKDVTSIIKQQMAKYKKENYPKNNGLNNGGIIFRKHMNTKNIMEFWWEEVDEFSVRDQLSLNYILWKHKVDYLTIDNKHRYELFSICEHKKDINYGVNQNFFKILIQNLIKMMVSFKNKLKK